MSRFPRISIRVWPARAQALEHARDVLGLENVTAAADWLITSALTELARREAAQLPHGAEFAARLPDGCHADAMRPPDGCRTAATEDNNDYLRINNYSKERGDFKGGEKISSSQNGSRAAAERLPLDDGEPVDREVENCLQILATIENWPKGEKNHARQRDYIAGLIGQHPRVDPLEVCERLKVMAIGTPLKPKGALSRLRTYFQKAEGFGQVRKPTTRRDEAPDTVDAEGVDVDA